MCPGSCGARGAARPERARAPPPPAAPAKRTPQLQTRRTAALWSGAQPPSGAHANDGGVVEPRRLKHVN